ncbi:MAG: helix-turn-helix domain-containing protein [Planctomycetes bacterium]|nr:helix-turn-helix domain-containing protein [Planctomycetota bacterium]MCD7897440.1 helix-turn-helix domain-containing protein [Planctomycetaceae bacterium]
MATLFGLRRQTVYEWKSGKRPIPWPRLKAAVDEFGLSWDWLLTGRGEKMRPAAEGEARPLVPHEINKRYLALFDGMSRAEIARRCGISQVAVYYIDADRMRVPWDRLNEAVETMGTTWEWLLEGRGDGTGRAVDTVPDD